MELVEKRSVVVCEIVESVTVSRRDERPIYFHRQLEGALNRVPYDFYDRLWHILERTPPGLKVAGYYLPQVSVVVTL